MIRLLKWGKALVAGNAAWAAVVAGLMAFGGLRWFIADQRSIGATNERLVMHEDTGKRVGKADTAGRKSAAGGGVRNPYYRSN